MDLTSDIFTSIFSPLAAFLPASDSPTSPSDSAGAAATTTTTTTSAENSNDSSNTGKSEGDNIPGQYSLTPWQTSPLNPQSRIDSLDPWPTSPLAGTPPSAWQLDGVDPTGRRFYASPRFALGKPPLRIDVYLPPPEAFPAWLREVIRPEQALYRPSRLVGDLSVGRWLLRVLQRWVGQFQEAGGQGERGKEGESGGAETALERKWWGMPFGSVLVVDVDAAGREQVCLVPEYGVEQGMVPVEMLRRMWEGEVSPDSWDGVQVVEWESLRFVRQVHEVISLVEVGLANGEGQLVAFKAVLQEQGYMYNELKMLLLLGGEHNVISKPLGVVTKKGRFGGRRGVCGFLLEWFPLGSLRDRLFRDDYQAANPMEQKFRWARQVTEAFIHVNSNAQAGFYPDLKPDNVLLKDNPRTGMVDAVLIDLEQRGGWFAWSPPEVAYLEYHEVLVDEPGLPEGEVKNEIVSLLRAYYGDPEWVPGGAGRGPYRNVQGGFSAPWLALLRQRRIGEEGKDLLERAQVFMLGKLLWCLFEGQPFVRCGIDHEVLRDANPEYESARAGKAEAFPQSVETPVELRRLIQACTAGAPEWEQGNVQGQPRVVLRAGKLHASDPANDLAAVAAQRFWARETGRAREFLRELVAVGGGGGQLRSGLAAVMDQAGERPLLSVVKTELERIERRILQKHWN